MPHRTALRSAGCGEADADPAPLTGGRVRARAYPGPMRRQGRTPATSATSAASRTSGTSGPTSRATPDLAARPAVPTAVVAAGSLVVGFGVAQATDVRALGGVVLLAGVAWCGRHWSRRQGPVTAGALAAAYLGGFVGSHLLAREIGAWPSVLTVAGAVGAAAWLASDRRG